MQAKGFTLIELLVVIAIVGILTSVVVMSFGTSQMQARDNARQTDLRNVQLAVERFRADTGSFPEAGAQWWRVLIPEYLSGDLTDWEWDYRTTDVQDRYIITISGVESLFTSVGHALACPESSHAVVAASPCSGVSAAPETVYAVYSEGVRALSSP